MIHSFFIFHVSRKRILTLFQTHSRTLTNETTAKRSLPKPPIGYENYTIGIEGNKLVVIDPGEAVFNRKWLGELLK